jgi:hypothetical protein
MNNATILMSLIWGNTYAETWQKVYVSGFFLPLFHFSKNISSIVTIFQKNISFGNKIQKIILKSIFV